jgi:hypothetical protein
VAGGGAVAARGGEGTGEEETAGTKRKREKVGGLNGSRAGSETETETERETERERDALSLSRTDSLTVSVAAGVPTPGHLITSQQQPVRQVF